MVTQLETLRKEVADQLTAAGLPGYAHVPERITPPAAVVLPGAPYVDGEDVTQCGTYRVRLRVSVLAGRGTNAAAADAMDRHIVTAVQALDVDHDVKAVAEPVEVELNGATYLGTVITIENVLPL